MVGYSHWRPGAHGGTKASMQTAISQADPGIPASQAG